MATRHRPSRTARTRRAALRLLALAVVVTLAAVGVVALLRHLAVEPVARRCAAVSEGTGHHLKPDQAETAALLAGTSLRRGLPARATTIAIATALQESKLRNIDYGDRDSVGIFQQRTSQGWGTVEEIMDPVYSTNAFFDALVRVDGYGDMPITEAAQAVQRSGFPDAYAQHEPVARAWASGLYGYTPEAVSCTLGAADGRGDPAQVAARVERDLGAAVTTEDRSGVVVDAASVAGAGEADRLGWAVAHWAVAVAEPLAVTQVEHAGRAWDRATGAWGPAAGPALPSGQVRIVLAD